MRNPLLEAKSTFRTKTYFPSSARDRSRRTRATLKSRVTSNSFRIPLKKINFAAFKRHPAASTLESIRPQFNSLWSREQTFAFIFGGGCHVSQPTDVPESQTAAEKSSAEKTIFSPTKWKKEWKGQKSLRAKAETRSSNIIKKLNNSAEESAKIYCSFEASGVEWKDNQISNSFGLKFLATTL